MNAIKKKEVSIAEERISAFLSAIPAIQNVLIVDEEKYSNRSQFAVLDELARTTFPGELIGVPIVAKVKSADDDLTIIMLPSFDGTHLFTCGTEEEVVVFTKAKEGISHLQYGGVPIISTGGEKIEALINSFGHIKVDKPEIEATVAEAVEKAKDSALPATPAPKRSFSDRLAEALASQGAAAQGVTPVEVPVVHVTPDITLSTGDGREEITIGTDGAVTVTSAKK